jgi:hypothetical protein
VGRVGVDAQRRVSVANRDQGKKFIRSGGSGARMNFMAQLDSQLTGVRADLGGLADEALLPLLNQVVSGPRLEAPRVTCGGFPAVGQMMKSLFAPFPQLARAVSSRGALNAMETND